MLTDMQRLHVLPSGRRSLALLSRTSPVGVRDTLMERRDLRGVSNDCAGQSLDLGGVDTPCPGRSDSELRWAL